MHVCMYYQGLFGEELSERGYYVILGLEYDVDSHVPLLSALFACKASI